MLNKFVEKQETFFESPKNGIFLVKQQNSSKCQKLF